MRIQIATALIASLFTAQTALADGAKTDAAPVTSGTAPTDAKAVAQAPAPTATQDDTAKPVTNTADASDDAKPVANTADTVVIVRGREPRPVVRTREVVYLEGSRFRGGIALEGGVLAVPQASLNYGMIGLQGQTGVQVNNLVGIYAVPSFDIGIGNSIGVNLAAALIVDFTPIDFFTFGVGPDVGVFVVGSGNDNSSSAAAGAVYGARLHLAINPLIGRVEGRPRRYGLTIGLDTRFLGGALGTATETTSTGTVTGGTGFVLQPMLTIGYQAF